MNTQNKDISAIDLSQQVTVENPKDLEICRRLKKTTTARICIGRAGERLLTQTMLRLRADHAVAMDAVWTEVNDRVADHMGFLKVQTLVSCKEEYITRPDKGRIFSQETLEKIRRNCKHNPDVQIIAADGLSSPAIPANLPDIYPVIVDGLAAQNLTVGTPIFVKYSRVAVMDWITYVLGAEVTVLLIGERPGLGTDESLSCYAAYKSSPDKPESQRNVISNIHKNGTPPVEAGAQIVSLVQIMLQKKNSGVSLKL
jgi:Ethanolamine ammonia-lyase, small subunit